MKPNIILTFDYEIFFGEKSGTFKNCIFRPVEKLREIMNKNEIKGIFFIDILYYIKLLDVPELVEEASLMEKQIKDLVKDGHRVELHLHPHWINSNYNEGKWEFKYNKYRFDQLTLEEREKIFEVGFKTLEKLAKSIDESYELKGYRAGGWCIQPFENFYPYFKKYKLIYDSSVIEQFKIKGEGHDVNFASISKKDIYKFSKEIEKEEIDGEFTEYKISYYYCNFLEKCINKILKLFISDKNYGDGVPMTVNNSRGIITKVLEKIKGNNTIYSLEGKTNVYFLLYKLSQEQRKNIVFLSHPKGMNNYGIKIIKKLKKEGYRFNIL